MSVDPLTWNWVAIGLWAWHMAPLVLGIFAVGWVGWLACDIHEHTAAVRELIEVLREREQNGKDDNG